MTRIGVEAGVPFAEIKRGVERLLRRASDGPGGCLLVSKVKMATPQLKVRNGRGGFVTLSATRAVFVAKMGGPPRDGYNAIRTCTNASCVAPGHVIARPTGVVMESSRQKHSEVVANACEKLRVWSDEEADELRRLVASGMTIKGAGRTLGMCAPTAQYLFAYKRGRGALVFRKGKRGTPRAPQCTRCGELGHWRDRGCPQMQEGR